ncbi:hypothetical protein WG906_07470 [Pedobacter sp. P351]|uniref:hypothetical protein n=1 Tax=Pedobacter superstes TaxID=3133441 RepID=UPI00309496C4
MKKPYLLLLLFLISSISCFAQAIVNPYVETVDDRACYISKIEITDKFTIVSFEHKNNNGWVRVSDKIYIETPDHTRYEYVKSEGIPVSPEKYTFKEGEESLKFKVYFKALPKRVKTVNIIEKEGDRFSFNFYGVSFEKSRTSDVQRSHTPVAEQPIANSDFPSAMFKSLGPIYSTLVKSMLNSSLEYYNEPGKLTELAKINKTYFEALRKEGFTRKEALKIMLSSPLSKGLGK